MAFDLNGSLQKVHPNPDHCLKALNLVPRPKTVSLTPC